MSSLSGQSSGAPLPVPVRYLDPKPSILYGAARLFQQPVHAYGLGSSVGAGVATEGLRRGLGVYGFRGQGVRVLRALGLAPKAKTLIPQHPSPFKSPRST